MRHVDMLRYAATQAEMSGSTDRALDYIQRRARRGRSRQPIPVVAGLVARTLRPLSLDAVAGRGPTSSSTAARPCGSCPTEPSAARAKVLATLGQQLMLAGGDDEAIAVCDAGDRGRAGGRRTGDRGARAQLAGRHPCAAWVAATRVWPSCTGRAQLALETESWVDLARAAVNEGGALQTMARDEEALALSLEGADAWRAPTGSTARSASFLRLNAIESLRVLGRWDEADEQFREVESARPARHRRLAPGRAALPAGRRAGRLRHCARRSRPARRAHGSGGRAPRPSDRRPRVRRDRGLERRRGRGIGPGAPSRNAKPSRSIDASLCSDVSIEVIIDGLAAGASFAARTRDPDAHAAVSARRARAGWPARPRGRRTIAGAAAGPARSTRSTRTSRPRSREPRRPTTDPSGWRSPTLWSQLRHAAARGVRTVPRRGGVRARRRPRLRRRERPRRVRRS